MQLNEKKPFPLSSLLQSLNKGQSSLLTWTKENAVNEKRDPMEFQNHKFIEDLYRCWADVICVKKAAQIGVTTWALIKSIWVARYNKVSVIFTMPKKTSITKFSQARVNPMLKYSRLGIPINVDNVGLKQIGDSFLYMGGTWGETDAISVPADMIVNDELDRSKPDVVEMLEERTSASFLNWKIKMSTPTYPDFGISALYKESDMREWIITCPAGHLQILRESNIKNDRYVCTKCGRPLDQTNGRWEPQRKSRIAGFHITQLMAPWIPAREILRKKNDYKFVADYMNFVLGEEYAGGEGMVNRLELMACFKPLTSLVGRPIVGVDWGDTTYVEVRQGHSIPYLGKIEGDTRTHAKQVAKIAEKFPNCLICADFGYGDTKNKDLIDWFPGRVWLCVYSDTAVLLHPSFHEKEDKKTGMITPIVNVDRTRSIEEALKEIKNGELKIQPCELAEEFVQHHLALIEKKEIDKHGAIRMTIEAVKADHYVHANNYTRLLLDQTRMVDISKDLAFMKRQPKRKTATKDIMGSSSIGNTRLSDSSIV